MITSTIEPQENHIMNHHEYPMISWTDCHNKDKSGIFFGLSFLQIERWFYILADEDRVVDKKPQIQKSF